MEARLIAGDATRLWCGGALDSRAVRGGELFFALAGEHTDGHLFVSDALSRGAAAAVVQAPVTAPPGATLVGVRDTFDALHALTRAVRRRTPRQLVAITGSAGKTTTKEILAALLARRYRVARSPGNLNNLYGFPLALLGVPEDTEWMVAEMGMSTPGELGQVSELGRPDVALFLNVLPVHLEGLGSLEAVADAKAELLDGLAADGLVIANAADPRVRKIAARHSGRRLFFGSGPDSEVRAERVAASADGRGSRFELHAGDQRAEVHLPLLGDHNVDNFVAAAACAWALGVKLDVIANAALDLAAAPGRGELLRTSGGATVIDDSYNSNPAALARTLSAAAQIPCARRWAVLGSMLELGSDSATYHRSAGAEAVGAGFERIVAVGEEARELAAGATAAGGTATWMATATEAAEWLTPLLEEGDLIVVKGSRGVGLDAVVQALVGGVS